MNLISFSSFNNMKPDDLHKHMSITDGAIKLITLIHE